MSCKRPMFCSLAYLLDAGDFVDRGSFSVEVILTLLAFSVLYPDCVHLARGNHESKNMNAMYGFDGEVRRSLLGTCPQRLPDQVTSSEHALCSRPRTCMRCISTSCQASTACQRCMNMQKVA